METPTKTITDLKNELIDETIAAKATQVKSHLKNILAKIDGKKEKVEKLQKEINEAQTELDNLTNMSVEEVYKKIIDDTVGCVAEQFNPFTWYISSFR